MADRVTIYEVSPRDGLQNEPRPIPTADKIALVDRLTACGFSHIEVASFVSPKWVPQMADGAAVLAGIARAPGVTYAALTPNLQGLRGGPRRRRRRGGDLRLGLRDLQPARTSTPRSPRASSDSRRSPRRRARDGMPLRGYVSCVTDCPFEGANRPRRRSPRVAERLFALGCREVSLGDTIGHGTPESVACMLQAVLDVAPPDRLAGHFHDTRGRALDNIEVGARLRAAGLRRLLRRARRLPLRARARPATSRPSGWRRGWPSSASRPASTRRGWPRRPPSPAACAAAGVTAIRRNSTDAARDSAGPMLARRQSQAILPPRVELCCDRGKTRTLGRTRHAGRTVVVLATDARINERLIARGMDPMRGPCLADVLHEATGERLTSREALRLWEPRAAGARPAGPRGAEPLRRGKRT